MINNKYKRYLNKSHLGKSTIFYLLVVSIPLSAQQFNSDNYLTMPHGTATMVITNGTRNATLYVIGALRPNFELAFQSTMFWENEKQGTPGQFTTNIYGKYMYWVNQTNNGGGAVFFGVGRAPGYFTQDGYSAMHLNYWGAFPFSFPLFNNTVFWDLMPGWIVDFDHGNKNKAAWGYSYSSRVAIYKVIPKTAIVAEIYGTDGQISSTPEYRVGLRWEPNDYIIPAVTYGTNIQGRGGPGFEIGLMFFTPPFLRKDFVRNSKIEYPPVKSRKK